MPWKNVWVKPRVFCRYKGVVVYHAYRDDDAENRLSCWYAVYPANDYGNTPTVFDIRSLPAPSGKESPEDDHVLTIKTAIRNGLLTCNGFKEPEKLSD